MIQVLLDSSNANLSVGIAKDHELIDYVNYDAWQRQSELLVSDLDKLLKNNNISKDDIDEIVAAKGPGSYTGVRISLTVGKVMAFALNTPLYLVSSLEALKVPNKPTICLINARSKRSYFGVYNGHDCIVEDTILTNDEVRDYIDKHPSYEIGGNTSYLDIDNEMINPLINLKDCDVERNLCKDVRTAKPVYLKDTYLR